MKKFLVASVAAAALCGAPAFAADVPTKAPAYVGKGPVAAANWTGCYVGLNAGYATGRAQVIRGAAGAGPKGSPITDPYNLDGAISGIDGGCNYQTGS